MNAEIQDVLIGSVCKTARRVVREQSLQASIDACRAIFAALGAGVGILEVEGAHNMATHLEERQMSFELKKTLYEK